MKKTVLFILVYLSAFYSFAQSDSLERQILNYTDSTAEIIRKGRGLLTDKFMEGDYEKVKEIKDYLIAKVSLENYIVFKPLEYWTILYWTQQYPELLTSLAHQDSITNSFTRRNLHFNDKPFEKKIAPPNDLLGEKLLKGSKDSSAQLYAFIDQSSLSREDKDYLKLRLDYINGMSNYTSGTRDSLNATADQFLKTYPNSSRSQFIRQNIRYEFVPSKWAFAFEFFSGYGILTNQLKNTFSNPVPLGIAFDISYKKVILFLRNYIGLNKTKTDVPYNNGIWEKGLQSRVYIPEASLGYVMLDNKIVKLIPFAGFAGTAFMPTESDLQENKALKNAGLNFTSAYTAGLNMDIKFAASKTRMVSYDEDGYMFLRLRYGYTQPNFQKRYGSYDGAVHNITVGIGGFGRAIKRKY